MSVFENQIFFFFCISYATCTRNFEINLILRRFTHQLSSIICTYQAFCKNGWRYQLFRWAGKSLVQKILYRTSGNVSRPLLYGHWDAELAPDSALRCRNRPAGEFYTAVWWERLYCFRWRHRELLCQHWLWYGVWRAIRISSHHSSSKWHRQKSGQEKESTCSAEKVPHVAFFVGI